MNVYHVTGQGREEPVSVPIEVAIEVTESLVPIYTKHVWVEEFGGGAWVVYPERPPETARSVLQSVLYGPAHQGPQGTRSTTGTWIHYPAL